MIHRFWNNGLFEGEGSQKSNGAERGWGFTTRNSLLFPCPLLAATAADLPRCAGEVERDVSTAFHETFWLPSPSEAGERERVSIRGRGAGGEGVKTGSAAQR